jgi:hypothetical protein
MARNQPSIHRQPRQHVEVEILKSIYDDANIRAIAENVPMSHIGRQILELAVNDPDTPDLVTLAPARRPRGSVKHRYRFLAPRPTYLQAALTVRNHGKSVARWLEYKLKMYAETGQI